MHDSSRCSNASAFIIFFSRCLLCFISNLARTQRFARKIQIKIEELITMLDNTKMNEFEVKDYIILREFLRQRFVVHRSGGSGVDG